MKWALILLALTAGSLMPVQAGINARLKQSLGDPVSAALVSFAVGTLVLAIYVFAAKKPLPLGQAWSDGPHWMWIGGGLGAFFVAATIVLAIKLGATAMTAWLIAGQLIFSVVLDNYGLIGYEVRSLSWQRCMGVVLLFAGAVLIKRF